MSGPFCDTIIYGSGGRMDIAQEGSQLTLGVDDDRRGREEALGRPLIALPVAEEGRILERLRICLENLDH